jgi:RNA polymerase sigma-70 factor, ECF subfamily
MLRFCDKASDNCEHAILENLDALYGFAMSLTRNLVEAEDLVQETCLRAIKGSTQRSIESDPKVWLFTILRHVWINDWRRRTKGPKFISLGENREEDGAFQQWLSDERERPDDNLERNVSAERIRTAIARLPVVFREVVILRHFEEFSYRQIATILGCPAGTVMSRLNRARAELRGMLDAKLKVMERKRGIG